MQYFWNIDYANREYPSKCYCSVPCKGNGSGTGNGECKKVTIRFSEWKSIITGSLED